MPIRSGEFYVPYRAHDVDHLTADGACLLGGQVTVVALLEAYAYLPWRSITSKTKRFLTVNHPD